MDDKQLRELLHRDSGIVLLSSSADSVDSEVEDKETLPNLELDVIIRDQYQGLCILGYGNFATVIKALDRVNKTIVAVKIFREGDEYDKIATNERYLLDSLEQNPVDGFSNIVRSIEYFKHDNKSCIVFEKLGHTLKHLRKKYKNGLNRNIVRIIIRSVMKGLQCLHENDIIHGDLKPSNIARKSNNSAECKILDIGGSFVANSCLLGELVQTPFYRAPEVFLGAPISNKIDIWSVGLITAELVRGTMLFQGDSYNELLYNYIYCFGIPPKEILEESLYLDDYFVTEGEEVKFKRSADGSLHKNTTKQIQDILKIQDDPVLCDFIKKCLLMDPEKRLSAKEAINHPFLCKQTSKTSTPAQDAGSSCTTI